MSQFSVYQFYFILWGNFFQTVFRDWDNSNCLPVSTTQHPRRLESPKERIWKVQISLMPRLKACPKRCLDSYLARPFQFAAQKTSPHIMWTTGRSWNATSVGHLWTHPQEQGAGVCRITVSNTSQLPNYFLVSTTNGTLSLKKKTHNRSASQ